MRTVLLPVFRNVVRRLIVECVLDAADADATVEAGLSASRKLLDPAMGAERMNLADVVRQLREEGMWFNGIDRSAERRNARAEDEEDEQQRERETEKERRHRAEGSDDSVGTLRTNAESRTLHRCSERRRARRRLGSASTRKSSGRRSGPARVWWSGRLSRRSLCRPCLILRAS
jgi:hypothetical protein